MRLAYVLVAGGFLVILLAFFPIALADWLPRSIQLLIGAVVLLVGVALVEVEALIRERDRS